MSDIQKKAKEFITLLEKMQEFAMNTVINGIDEIKSKDDKFGFKEKLKEYRSGKLNRDEFLNIIKNAS